MREKSSFPVSGGLMLVVALGLLLLAAPYLFVMASKQAAPDPVLIGSGIAATVFGLFFLGGFMVIGPNEAQVLQFFGRYVGTARNEGLRWTNPLNTKTKISLRARNFETSKIKVNDVEGNPIEIAAIAVWKVVDTAQACFSVENYHAYVQVQAEAAVRNLATQHPYDAHDDSRLSLRGQPEAIAELLKREIADRVKAAGVEIIEARIAHLAYAPEIAQAMLQRQQAGAIIAARQLIVEGAVSMVQMALQQLSARGVVELDTERKAQMVSNLLVVLCGERATQPIVNAGS
jgi:hypothetical protein